MVKKNKNAQELKCVALLNDKKMYGYIRHKNIEYRKKIRLTFSEFEYWKFYSYIVKGLKNDKHKVETAEYYEMRFLQPSAEIGFIPHELMRRAYEYIKALRRKIFPDVPPELRKYRRFSQNQYDAYMLRKLLRNLERSRLSAETKKYSKRDKASS